jgi:uncharacterized protein (TIGR03083 family)
MRDMEIAEHIEVLALEGERTASAAEAAGADAEVPTCPDWVVRDLLHHQGGVFRWAGAYVAGAVTDMKGVDFVTAAGTLPHDAQLFDWFRQSHADLVATLRAADPSLQCWTFLAAPSPLAFWARRQAHESSIHRVDAELADEVTPEVVAPQFGADGIDELLTGFLPRRQGDPRADPPRSLAVRCDDIEAGWRLTVSPERVTTTAEPGGDAIDGAAAPDCFVHGSASDLYHSLWNRLPADVLTIEGDPTALDLFMERNKIRWTI